MDRKVPEGCEVRPAPERLRKCSYLRLVSERAPTFPDKPVRRLVCSRDRMQARQARQRRHQRRMTDQVEMGDSVAGRLCRHQLLVEGREGLRQGNHRAGLDHLPAGRLARHLQRLQSKQPLHAHVRDEQQQDGRGAELPLG